MDTGNGELDSRVQRQAIGATNGESSEPANGDEQARARSRRARTRPRKRVRRDGITVGDGTPLPNPPETFEAFERALIAAKSPLADPEDPAWKTHKAVMECLCRREYRGITSRDPGSLEIRATDNGFVVSVSDFGLGSRISVRSETLLGCFTALQEGFDRQRTVQVSRLKRGKGAERLREEEKKELAKLQQKR